MKHFLEWIRFVGTLTFIYAALGLLGVGLFWITTTIYAEPILIVPAVMGFVLRGFQRQINRGMAAFFTEGGVSRLLQRLHATLPSLGSGHARHPAA